MTPQLRPYQQRLADEVRTAYRMGFHCPLVVASTGAGKTVLFSYITFHAQARGTPVIAAAHRKEIIRQISLSFARFGIDHDVIAPQTLRRSIMAAQFRAFGRSFVKSGARVMVGSVQTLVTRFDTIDAILAARCDGKAPLIIMDEGHHVVEDTQWGAVMERYHVQRGGKALIVTASPQRLDGRGLGKGHGGFADTMIEAPPMTWLIENGFLSPYRAFTAPKQIDLQGVHTRMGDFVSTELAERVDKPSITGDAIAHWRQHANGLRAVAFCVSVEHSKHVAAEFNAAGIPAAHIDGAVDDSERDQAIIDFAAGKVLVLTNVNIVSEGFDLGSIAQADVTIDCLIDLAPTQSLVNFMQRAGRALRPAPGKVAVLLDHAGNIYRHGLPDQHREWTLEGVKRQKRQAKEVDDEQGVDRVVTCSRCFTIHLPAPQCPNCNFVYPEKARKVEQAEGELQELTEDQLDAMRRARRVLQGQAQTVDDLVHQMGMSRGRAQKIVQAREAKQAQIDAVLAGIERLSRPAGVIKNMSREEGRAGSPYRILGVTFGDIRRAKPKELAALQVRIDALLKDRAEKSEMRAA